jgi:hypothetical protein
MQELTITQNSALYLAQHRVLKRPKRFSGGLGRREEINPPILGGPTFREMYLVTQFYRDNGR